MADAPPKRDPPKPADSKFFFSRLFLLFTGTPEKPTDEEDEVHEVPVRISYRMSMVNKDTKQQPNPNVCFSIFRFSLLFIFIFFIYWLYYYLSIYFLRFFVIFFIIFFYYH